MAAASAALSAGLACTPQHFERAMVAQRQLRRDVIAKVARPRQRDLQGLGCRRPAGLRGKGSDQHDSARNQLLDGVRMAPSWLAEAARMKVACGCRIKDLGHQRDQ